MDIRVELYDIQRGGSWLAFFFFCVRLQEHPVTLRIRKMNINSFHFRNICLILVFVAYLVVIYKSTPGIVIINPRSTVVDEIDTLKTEDSKGYRTNSTRPYFVTNITSSPPSPTTTKLTPTTTTTAATTKTTKVDIGPVVGGSCTLWEKDWVQDMADATGCQETAQCNSNIKVLAVSSMDPNKIAQLLACHPSIKVLFHSSDETCKVADFFQNVYPRFKLVVKQYACLDTYNELYTAHPNVIISPLGYMKGALHGKSVFTFIEETLAQLNRTRSFKWSFIGDRNKYDRIDALKAFSAIQPNKAPTSHMAPSDMLDVYRDSNLVVCPRGNSLDTFRHFESSISGAIPVTVASEKELNFVFGGYRKHPPFIMAHSWPEAAARAGALLQNKSALLERRRAVVLWIKSEIERVHQRVMSALEN